MINRQKGFFGFRRRSLKPIQTARRTNTFRVGLTLLLIAATRLGMLFSLKTHREFFGSVTHGEEGEEPWPIGLALATLAGVTVLVALVSEIFVPSAYLS